MASSPITTGMLRGARLRCPNCGEGKLYRKFLKVDPTCPVCGHDNSRYKADDAPPYFTILIVGHVVIAPMLAFRFIQTSSPWLILAVTLPLLAALSLAMLPSIKGATVGLQWGLREKHAALDNRPAG